MPKRVSTGYCVSVYNKMELKTFKLRGLQKKRFETTLPVRTKQIKSNFYIETKYLPNLRTGQNWPSYHFMPVNNQLGSGSVYQKLFKPKISPYAAMVTLHVSKASATRSYGLGSSPLSSKVPCISYNFSHHDLGFLLL